MKLFKRRNVRVPYDKIRRANTLRNDSTKRDWEHWQNYREQIQAVIAHTLENSRDEITPGHLLLLGAGNGNDVPISYIETVFDRITIVDIDERALDRFVTRAKHPEKFRKAVMDLTGFGKEIATLDDLKAKIETLEPSPDFSPIESPVDMAMNLCFTTQLLSAYFYKEKKTEPVAPALSAQLNQLIGRIHIRLFEGLAGLLAPHGMVIHLTDTLLLQQIKQDGYISPATPKADELVKGNRRENIHLLYDHLPEFAEADLCLPGAFVHFHPEIRKLFTVKAHFSLLWEFVHDAYEYRDYYVTAHVMEKN